METRPTDALMARFGDYGPQFKVCDPTLIEFWRWRGFFLLITEIEVRFADVQDVRLDDERGFGR